METVGHRRASTARREPKGAAEGGDRGLLNPWLRRGARAIQSTFGLAVASAVLLGLAFPPIGLAAVIWVAPAPLLLLVRRQAWPRARWPYARLYAAGFVSWLLILHWLRLPHWAGYVSWPALAALMAIYFPLFVAVARVMVHRLGVSVVVAAPVAWTAGELFRAHFLGGFSMASLYHAHYRWLALIQVADLAGGLTLSFVIMLAAACLARMIPWDGKRAALWPIAPAVLAVAATLAYGYHRLGEIDTATPSSTNSGEATSVKVALIQGSFNTEFVYDPDRPKRIIEGMSQRTRAALDAEPDLDLVIWPETMFFAAWENAAFTEDLRKFAIQGLNRFGKYHAALLTGAEVRETSGDGGSSQTKGYNSALFVAPDGEIVGRYDKMNPVMFGEYIPFGEQFPWLYQLSPLRGGLTAGARPEALAIPVRGAADDNGGDAPTVTFCPSICYESVLPHHVRGSVATLAAEGKPVDVLVNLTNSGWFWGSSELDLHLMCNVFRAVECRKPMLVAANTGFSAWIDAAGRIRRQGKRHQEDTVIAQVSSTRIFSRYVAWGDWLGGICLGLCGLAAVFEVVCRGIRGRRLFFGQSRA